MQENIRQLDPKPPPPIAEFAAEFLSAEKNKDIRIIKRKQHSNKGRIPLF